MDLVRLRSFLVLMEELHFGRAAALLGIAQPHLSRRIQELERSMGVELFRRSQRHVEPTAAGRSFAERVTAVLAALDNAALEAREVAAGISGRLRIGFIHSSTYGVLPATLKQFRAMRPDIAIELREMTILAQIDALRSGDIDLGILRPIGGEDDLAYETVLHEPFRLAVPQDHPLARRRSLRLSDTMRERFIMFPREASPLFHARITAAFDAVGVIPNVVQEATQIHTVLGLVGAGLGIALVPNSSRQLDWPAIRLLEIDQAPEPVEICIGWRRDQSPPAREAFVDAARNAAGSLGRQSDRIRA
ncbi:LysR family transcriptional regulator [Enterovirga rhinocerotis]|uniref:LysR family transcriptional regulator n=1 Tax=Enterovirga rhinocerotis TaxID=1339210 RepID=A0A4V3DZ95_9HYPH|nr:LysR family transcriptional regulator [Enterovirga rhinocerotis]TDR95687.1 LysR family transcriptional regulator [Enterovirga rhinocerotis]